MSPKIPCPVSPKTVPQSPLQAIGLKDPEKLTERARKLGLNPADVLEAFGHPNPRQEEFRAARDSGDTKALWELFRQSQKGSLFAKKVLQAILVQLDGPEAVAEMWSVYHLSSGECDLAEEILHKINVTAVNLQDWMDVITHSKKGDDVHEEAVRMARMHTTKREVLWTLLKATENYPLRKSILAKLLMTARTRTELMRVLRTAEHGYPELRNRCIQKIMRTGLKLPREEEHGTARSGITTAANTLRPIRPLAPAC